ncbi:hypothetical protein Psta_3108 [Pirellula staleyi DSM 6068]|uniref:YbjN domain-containing protein n=1 Tax=Pirellula staleyi (strain ATCC 27377 / DSM 6068 / ICPB 4128) TaxID=530564 RepID=D2QWG9_PIRSD|nr:YbjN domain-containing protein [Pirellula staleyi]ADB17772.1 hypothetical protein Psta_3108 [Pirellula staleyi DSM 6068]
MFRPLLASLVVFATLLTTSTLAAQDAPPLGGLIGNAGNGGGAGAADKIIEKLSPDVVIEVLKAEGYKDLQHVPSTKEDSPDAIFVTYEGRRVLVVVPNGGDLLQVNYFVEEHNATLKKVNDWNRNHYITKACILSDTSVSMGADLVVAGSKKTTMAKFLNYYFSQLAPFYKEVCEE